MTGKLFLAVSSDIEKFNEHRPVWDKYGLLPERVSTMSEAIERLAKNEYFLIGINADNVDYISQLRMMRDITQAPIHILKSDYSVEEHIHALHCGADFFSTWGDSMENIALLGEAMIHRYFELINSQKAIASYITHHNVLMKLNHRKVYIDGQEIRLTRKEFDILHLLISKPGRVFTYEQIFRRVWGEEYIDSANNVLWCGIGRLRKKIEAVTKQVPIITVRDVGYKFDVQA